MENTWGMQPASSGMNFSAAPAAAMWWDMCPISAQPFQGSANETLPAQTHEPLADVLEEIGIGSTNGSQTVLDLKTFTKSLEGRPIYSRYMLFLAAYQLPRARLGQNITLLDCYGKPVFFPEGSLPPFGEEPVLAYNGIHELTDHFQADSNVPLLPVFLKYGDRQRPNRVVTFDLTTNKCREPEVEELQSKIDWYEQAWRSSGARATLHNSLRKLIHTARITNIICIGLGTMDTKEWKGARSILQHVVASFIAQDLTQLYEAEGIPLENPIEIYAQDPAYTHLDRTALGNLLPRMIRAGADPKGFLAIRDDSLVFSSWPSAPVKQLIADLTADVPDALGPAALFLNNNHEDKVHGDLDVVRYNRDDPVRHTNAESKAYVKLLESYTQVLDGERQFGIGFGDKLPGFEWLSEMDIWGREE